MSGAGRASGHTTYGPTQDQALSNNISSLLSLFEESAKSYMKKQETGAPGDEKDLLRKLDTLLDQNKTIAKGLTLIEEKIRHKVYPENAMNSISKEEEVPFGMPGRPRPRPLPKI